MMKASVNPYFLVIQLLSVVFLYARNKEALAGRMPESTGKFILVETPDDQTSSKYLVIKKHNGRKSLIELEKQTNIEDPGKKERGNKNCP